MIQDTIIFAEATLFRVAVEKHLKSKSRLPVTISFRGDVYKSLFGGKWTLHERWHLLEKSAFPRKYFPEFWDYSADSHGQGIKVFYPIKVRPHISWSPKKYSVLEGHHPTPRAFQEKLTFSFIKVALDDYSNN